MRTGSDLSEGLIPFTLLSRFFMLFTPILCGCVLFPLFEQAVQVCTLDIQIVRDHLNIDRLGIVVFRFKRLAALPDPAAGAEYKEWKSIPETNKQDFRILPA